MHRGTTPTINFRVSIDKDTLDKAWITFAQLGKEQFTKNMEDSDISGNLWKLKLSQADTLKLVADKPVEIQFRVRLKNGDSLASKILTVDAERILKDGEI